MTHPTPDLAALIGSRICHDLISPVGAIANGLELMALGGAAQGPEFSLVNDSAAHAGARIRFFRIAFGHANAGQSVSETELRALLGSVYAGSVAVDWQITGALSRRLARIGFLALMCLEKALPRGGRITVTGTADAPVFHTASDDLSTAPELWDILRTGSLPGDLPPAQVQIALLALALRDSDVNFALELSETEIRMAF